MKDSTSLRYTLDLWNTEPHGDFGGGVNSFDGEWYDAGTPFNGALRGVNFKMFSMNHDGKAQTWCTDAFRKVGYGHPPCGNNEIEQFSNDYTNGWEKYHLHKRLDKWRAHGRCGIVVGKRTLLRVWMGDIRPSVSGLSFWSIIPNRMITAMVYRTGLLFAVRTNSMNFTLLLRTSKTISSLLFETRWER